MKAIKLVVCICVAIVLLFASCSVEKRRYHKGYNVESRNKAPKTEEKPEITVTTPEMDQTIAPVIPGTISYLTDVNTSYNFKVVVGPRPDKSKIQAKHKPMP
jgi:hypothetical protein